MSGSMEVWQWVSAEQAEKENRPDIGTMGGFFQNGMRWKDYLEAEPLPAEYAEALRRSILKLNIRFGGDEHQSGEKGTPIFSDGKMALLSMRAWGDLLAAVWSEHESKDYCYMDFYMTCLVPKSVET